MLHPQTAHFPLQSFKICLHTSILLTILKKRKKKKKRSSNNCRIRVPLLYMKDVIDIDLFIYAVVFVVVVVLRIYYTHRQFSRWCFDMMVDFIFYGYVVSKIQLDYYIQTENILYILCVQHNEAVLLPVLTWKDNSKIQSVSDKSYVQNMYFFQGVNLHISFQRLLTFCKKPLLMTVSITAQSSFKICIHIEKKLFSEKNKLLSSLEHRIHQK